MKRFIVASLEKLCFLCDSSFWLRHFLGCGSSNKFLRFADLSVKLDDRWGGTGEWDKKTYPEWNRPDGLD